MNPVALDWNQRYEIEHASLKYTGRQIDGDVNVCMHTPVYAHTYIHTYIPTCVH